MAERTKRRLRRPERKPAKVVEPVVEDDDFDEEPLDEEFEDEEDLEDEDDEVEEEAPRRRAAPVMKKKERVVTRKIDIPKAPPAELKEAVANEVSTLSDPIPGLLEQLEDGKTLLVQKQGKGFLVSLSQEVVSVGGRSKGKLSNADYANEVLHPEYVAWQEKWRELPMEEKRKQAKKAGCEWEPHEHLQTEAMRIAEVYREKAGIPKYKPEYETRAARDAARKRFTN